MSQAHRRGIEAAETANAMIIPTVSLLEAFKNNSCDNVGNDAAGHSVSGSLIAPPAHIASKVVIEDRRFHASHVDMETAYLTQENADSSLGPGLRIEVTSLAIKPDVRDVVIMSQIVNHVDRRSSGIILVAELKTGNIDGLEKAATEAAQRHKESSSKVGRMLIGLSTHQHVAADCSCMKSAEDVSGSHTCAIFSDTEIQREA